MPQTNDIHITSHDIQSLNNRDAIYAFLTHLGYASSYQSPHTCIQKQKSCYSPEMATSVVSCDQGVIDFQTQPRFIIVFQGLYLNFRKGRKRNQFDYLSDDAIIEMEQVVSDEINRYKQL